MIGVAGHGSSLGARAGRSSLVRSTDSLRPSWRSSSLATSAGRGHVDDGVDALGLLLDVVGEPATAPDVDVLDRATVLADDVEELVEARSDGALLELGVEDDHQFVLTHVDTHLLWSRRSRSLRDRRVMHCSHCRRDQSRTGTGVAARAQVTGEHGRATKSPSTGRLTWPQPQPTDDQPVLGAVQRTAERVVGVRQLQRTPTGRSAPTSASRARPGRACGPGRVRVARPPTRCGPRASGDDEQPDHQEPHIGPPGQSTGRRRGARGIEPDRDEVRRLGAEPDQMLAPARQRQRDRAAAATARTAPGRTCR